MIPKVLKSFNLFVDGRGYAGVVSELTLPKLSIKMEEHIAGGMDMPVSLDMGMEKLECDFTLSEYDPEIVKSFGLSDGAQVPLVLRGGLDGEEGVTPVVVTVTGAWSEIDFGGWKAGDKPDLKVQVSVRYYKLEIDGNELVEIDVLNMIRKIDGNDQLETLRGAIGI